jgi:hypothetical protein
VLEAAGGVGGALLACVKARFRYVDAWFIREATYDSACENCFTFVWATRRLSFFSAMSRLRSLATSVSPLFWAERRLVERAYVASELCATARLSGDLGLQRFIKFSQVCVAQVRRGKNLLDASYSLFTVLWRPGLALGAIVAFCIPFIGARSGVLKHIERHILTGAI